MYKVEKYIYEGETNEEFTNGEIYTVRKSKGGSDSVITTDKGEKTLFVSKLSQINDMGRLLMKHFQKKDETVYKNYKEYKKSEGK